MAYYRYTVKGFQASNAIFTTHHQQSADPLSNANLQAFCDALQVAYDGVYGAFGMFSNQYGFQEIEVVRVDIPSLPVQHFGVTLMQGNSGDDALPIATTLPLTWRSNTVRPNRGRNSFGGFTLNALADNGSPTTVFTGHIETLGTDINAALTSVILGTQHVIARYTGGPPRVTLSNDVESWSASPRFGTMRSRISGRGI